MKQNIVADKIAGLSMMIVFTAMWTIMGEVALSQLDYHIGGIGFGGAVVFLAYQYFQLRHASKSLPKSVEVGEKKEDKRFLIIFGIEGVAIFIVKNVLYNTNHDEYFIASLALIVGLHFFPLAKVFGRKFDYYIGSWTTFISLLGIYLIFDKQYSLALINAMVCFGCALSTVLYGLNMVKDAKDMLK